MLSAYRRCLHVQLRGVRLKSTSIKSLLKETEIGKDVTVTGWVTRRRKLKHALFLDVNDGSTFQHLQVVLPTSDTPETVTVGSSVRVTGEVVASDGAGQDIELRSPTITVLGTSEESPQRFPLQAGTYSRESMRPWQHLRPRIASMASIFRLRSAVVSAVHKFFDQEEFHYTNPPIIVRSDAEGAGETFTITQSHNNFFGLKKKKSRLTVSSQLHLEAMIMGLGKVWTLSPTFRAEKSITSRHLCEFWMLEAEFLADELQDLTSNLASLLRFVVMELRKGDILTELITTLPLFEAHRESEILSRWNNLGQSKWTEISYDEAIKLLIPQHEITLFDIAPVAGKPLQSEHEQFIASMFSTPVFVTHYPAAIKPFYMKKSEDRVSVNNFDLIVPEMGEIAGGGLRLDDLAELVAIMDEKRMDRFELKWYRDLRRWGSVPHGGYGLGFDRFIAYLAGVDNVREIVAFPRFYGTSGCQN